MVPTAQRFIIAVKKLGDCIPATMYYSCNFPFAASAYSWILLYNCTLLGIYPTELSTTSGVFLLSCIMAASSSAMRNHLLGFLCPPAPLRLLYFSLLPAGSDAGGTGRLPAYSPAVSPPQLSRMLMPGPRSPWFHACYSSVPPIPSLQHVNRHMGKFIHNNGPISMALF